MREYLEYTKQPMFSIRDGNCYQVRGLNNLVAEMIHSQAIEIWKRLDTNLPGASSLFTSKTPKLTRLWRGLDATE